MTSLMTITLFDQTKLLLEKNKDAHISDICNALGMNLRTYQRNLKKENNTTFAKIKKSVNAKNNVIITNNDKKSNLRDIKNAYSNCKVATDNESTAIYNTINKEVCVCGANIVTNAKYCTECGINLNGDDELTDDRILRKLGIIINTSDDNSEVLKAIQISIPLMIKKGKIKVDVASDASERELIKFTEIQNEFFKNIYSTSSDID